MNPDMRKQNLKTHFAKSGQKDIANIIDLGLKFYFRDSHFPEPNRSTIGEVPV